MVVDLSLSFDISVADFFYFIGQITVLLHFDKCLA